MDEDDRQTKDEASKTQRTVRTLSINPEMFGLRIVDEAHRIKNENSLQTEAIYRLQNVKTILASATPYKNFVRDLYGLLRFLYAHLRDVISEDEDPLSEGAYVSLRKSLVGQYDSDVFKVPDQKRRDYLRGLEPGRFRELCGASEDLGAGTRIMPLPSTMAILRRVKGTAIHVCGQSIVLGKEIPAYKVVTVEVRQGGVERSLYRGVLESTKAMASGHSGPTEEDDDEGVNFAGMLKRRRLTLASFNVMLDQFTHRRVNSSASFIHKL